MKVRLLNVRAEPPRRAITRRPPSGIEAVRKLEGLDAEQRRGIEAICDALETLIAVREGDPPAILRHTDTFPGPAPASRVCPSPTRRSSRSTSNRPLRASTCGSRPRSSGLSSSSRPRPGARSPRSRGSPLTDDQVAWIARPLFRALQFELRQRDILAALGRTLLLVRAGPAEASRAVARGGRGDGRRGTDRPATAGTGPCVG